MDTRIDRIKEQMLKDGYDALVPMSLENVFYSTAAYIRTQRYLRERLEIAVLSDKGEDVFIICGLEESGVKRETWIKDIRPYIEFTESPIRFLVDVLREKGLESGRIGIEKQFLGASDYEALTAALPQTDFLECRGVFDRVRMIKEPKEIEILTDAAIKTEKALNAALLVSSDKDTELELSNRVTINLLQHAMDELAFMFLGTGTRSALVHPIPSREVPLKSGDLIRIDFGGIFSGYYSDLARTIAVGKPPQEKIDSYRKLALTHQSVLEKLQPGMRFSEIYEASEKAFADQGLPFKMPHAGHGLGLECHEYPMINPINEEKLQENMTFNIELAFIHHDTGYQIENMIHMTSSGPKIITGRDLGLNIPTIH